MQLHQLQRTPPRQYNPHLSLLDSSPRSTPIPGSFDTSTYQNANTNAAAVSKSDKHYRLLGIQAAEAMPIATTGSISNTHADLHPSSTGVLANNNSTNQSTTDQFFYNSASKTTSGGGNNSTNNLRYHHNPNHHHFDSDNNNTNGSVTARDRDLYLHSSDLPMTTDDEASSTASFRHRPRKLSKAESVPSPLGGNANKNNSSNALSTFSFLSSGDKTSNGAVHNSMASSDSKSPSQLRVRHLETHSTYAGYLTKFSSRTFFSRKQWKRRYFILNEKSLYCFKSSDPQHPLLESIALSPEAIICVTDEFSGKRYCLQISCPGEKNWYVLADTASEMSGWLKELKSTVLRARNTQLDARAGTHYSDESEISDLSGTSTAMRVPSVPAIPSQYDYMSSTTRSLPATLSSSGPSSLPTRPGQSSLYPQQQHQHLDLYQGQMTSLNPPPRSITPKPLTPTPGSAPQRSTTGTSQVHSYRASIQPHQLSPSPQQQSPETRRRRNSSLSAGQPASDYASFGSVMQRAEAMAEAQREAPSSSWSIPTKVERTEPVNYATLPRSKRESTTSNMSSMSSTHLNYRASIMTDRSESSVSPPQRPAQRAASTSARPLSPATSRPLSPSLSRTSPRNSFVISPPPRSIHRPTSVSIRHSTQILPHPQIATAGLPPQRSATNSPLLSSNPPTSSLPATPESNGNLSHLGSLSRITSIRHQREAGGLYRNSVISVASTTTGSLTGSATGSIQERVQRSSSRTSIMRPTVPLTGVLPMRPTDLLGVNRSISPTPSLAAAPTLPLPEPPRAGSISPSKAMSGANSVASASLSSQSSELSRRISSVPRHHEPDLPIPNRSKARVRSQSQEAALITAKLDDLQLSRRATTPSPRLSAAVTSTNNKDHRQSMMVGDSIGISGNGNINGHGNGRTVVNGSNHSRQMSLPIHTMYVLPAPPTGQAPSQPSLSATPSTSSPSRPLMQRPSGSGAALRPISSSVNNNVASLGGGIARRPSATNAAAVASIAAATAVGGASTKRESVMSGRLSTLGSLPPGPTTAVPLPPVGVLPAPPTSALPKKPTDKSGDGATDGKKSKRATNAQVGFNIIPEEEEEEEEDEDDEECVSQLQFEELEAAKAATEFDQDPDSAVTTPTTSSATRPEYYATKQRKVVEYIFPSESFAV